MTRDTLQAGVLQVVVSIILNDGDAVLLAKPIDLPFPAKGRHYACVVALYTLLSKASGIKLKRLLSCAQSANRNRTVRINYSCTCTTGHIQCGDMCALRWL